MTGDPPRHPPAQREIIFDLFRAWEAQSRAYAAKLREEAAKNPGATWAEDACALANVIEGAADRAAADVKEPAGSGLSAQDE